MKIHSTLVTVCLAMAAVALGCTTTIAPDAPRATQEQPVQRKIRSIYLPARPIRLAKVSVRKIAKDSKELRQYVGKAFLKRATDPIRLSVSVSGRLPMGEGTSSLVIVLNGVILHDSWLSADDPTALFAYLPDGKLIKESNRVNLQWIGRPNDQLARRFLVFTESDIQ